MIVGVVKETLGGERRVALTPDAIASLSKAGLDVVVESNAGASAGFADDEFQANGASITSDRSEVLSRAHIVGRIWLPTAPTGTNFEGFSDLRADCTYIGLADPLGDRKALESLASTGAQTFALELMPRITRAQNMDVLSSQATVSGYKAVLLASTLLPRMFPLMMTAAGTVVPARVFVIGAGVAGLQAIATAHRLGAVVTAYDIRPAVKEQVESVGARFLQLELSTDDTESQGGYARAMDEEFYDKQRELMAAAVAEADVVITTAVVPGKKAPVLITSTMVDAMSPGSVIVDLAARPNAQGGNCELTQPDQTVVEHDVSICGPTNLPATVPHTSSRLFARNLTNFILHFTSDAQLHVDRDDDIVAATLLTQNGSIVNEQVCTSCGVDSVDTPSTQAIRGPDSATRSS